MAHSRLYNFILDASFNVVVRIIRIAGWWIDKTTKK